MRLKGQGKSDQRPTVVTDRRKKRGENETPIEAKEALLRDFVEKWHPKRNARSIRHTLAPFSLAAGHYPNLPDLPQSFSVAWTWERS
jgi:hypothetical protein